MLLLVGLGNPGPRHAADRHNIGFMAVDAIARRHGFGPARARFHGLVSEGLIDAEKVIALKPETYMNHSGRAVAAAAQFYKLPLDRVVVVYDEIDLRFGKVRVKRGGGAGGHNGIRSIDAHLGADYWRVRLGIGHPGHPELVHRYVLHPFAKEEQPTVAGLTDAVAEAFPLLAAGDANGFMNKVTVLTNPPKPKASEPDATARQDGNGT